MRTLPEAARAYAAHGWPIFPVVPRQKHPLTSRGFHDATTDADIVTTWWREAPEANIGFVPGRAGLIVIDVDGAEGEAEARALGLLAEPTARCLTARGEHRYYQHPGGGTITNRKLTPHTDVRADAGYVLLPPSIHPSGTPYRLAERRPPSILPPAVAAMLEEPAPRVRAGELPEVLPEGGRNSWLTSLAGSARRRGATSGAILAMLEAENAARCQPPLSSAELERIATSVARYPARQPAPKPERESGDPPETKTQRNVVIGSEAQASLDDEAALVSWGWRDFDQRFGAIVAGRLYVIGGRPGTGKTTLLLNVLSRLWQDRVPTLYFGTEMAPAELVKKWAAMRCEIDELAVFERRISADERRELSAEMARLMDQDLVTFSTASRLDVGRMASEIAWAYDARTGPPPRVVILDHLHRVTQDREELEILARELADVSIERNAAVLVAAQLNREHTHGALDLYMPPNLGRYKGSAAIEENAAVAFGLYRPLVKGITVRQRAEVERGDKPVTEFAQPNGFGIICTKHRYHGTAVGRSLHLVLRGSNLEAQAFQTAPWAATADDPVPF